MYITLAILVLSAVFFMNGRVRSDLVALCALLGLLVFQILTPEEALAGFANPIVIMMIGLFVVGGAIFQTGLAKMVSSRILGLAGNSELKLFILVMLVTAAIGAFISNTGTVALMLPIVVSLAANANMNVSRVLMPLAFASSMGGMLTLIGTAPEPRYPERTDRRGLPAADLLFVHSGRPGMYPDRNHRADPAEPMVPRSRKKRKTATADRKIARRTGSANTNSPTACSGSGYPPALRPEDKRCGNWASNSNTTSTWSKSAESNRPNRIS